MLLKFIGKDIQKIIIITFRRIPLSILKCQLTFNNLASTHKGKERKENKLDFVVHPGVTYKHQLSTAIPTKQAKNGRLLLLF